MAHVDAIPVVLIVDDELLNVTAFVRTFRRDFAVRTATSGAEALRTLEAERVDVVLSDFSMPSMNGADLLQIVAERWPGTGRVILSGHADLDDLRDARPGVIDALVAKPWAREGVLEVVTRVLGARRPSA